MEHLDLNINNYDLNSLLSLFNLAHNFSYKDLKTSIKKLYKIHPDKSGLDPKYFIFFKEAYTILLNIYKFKNKSSNTFREDFYARDKHIKLKSLIDSDNFNNNFNKLFEDTFKRETHGYGKWLKEDTPPDYEGHNRKTYFSNKRKNIIIKPNTDFYYEQSGINNLDNSDQNEYVCDKHANLKFDDIRKVYSETFIPVDDSDKRINEHQSLEQLKLHRKNQHVTILTNEESQQYFNKQENDISNTSNNRIYTLLKQDDKYKKQQEEWWKKFNKLCI